MRVTNNSRTTKTAVAFAVIIPFCLYLLTLCRGIPIGDAPELALAAIKYQIAHPPGYPLLTNVGRVWSVAFFFLRPIVALNLLSAVFAAVACGLTYKVLSRLVNRESITMQVVLLATAVTFAAGRTLWSVATNFEVYSLAALFAVLVIFFLIRFVQTGESRDFILAAYLLGLSLCNHLSLLALAPAVLIAAISMRSVLRLRVVIIAGVLFALPGTLYGYLLIRSRFDLILSWYNPQRWTGLKQQMFAETYQRFVVSPSLADVAPHLQRLGQLFAHEWVLPISLLALVGLLIQWRYRRAVAMMLSSIVVANCALNFSYTISDIAPYYLPSTIAMIIWIFELFAWLMMRSRPAKLLAVVSSVIFAVVSVSGNFAASDLANRTKSELYAQDLFDRVPTKGILFCGSDNSMFPTLYLRYVEDYRSDCEVYGHLPTLSRLQRDLGYKFEGAWTKFPDLLKQAVGSGQRPAVMARELMNYENDFPRIIDSLFATDLVYVADSARRVMPGHYRIDLESLPDLFDPKEALMYTVYQLAAAESAEFRGDADAERYYRRTVKTVNGMREASLSSALAAYFVDRGQHRFAIAVLEPALQLKTLRTAERLRLLGGAGLAYLRLQNSDAARKVFDQMLVLDDMNTEARFQIMALDASESVQSGNLAAAISTYERMEQLAPEQHQVAMQLALLYLKTFDYDSARSELERCIAAGYRSDEARALLNQLDSQTIK